MARRQLRGTVSSLGLAREMPVRRDYRRALFVYAPRQSSPASKPSDILVQHRQHDPSQRSQMLAVCSPLTPPMIAYMLVGIHGSL